MSSKTVPRRHFQILLKRVFYELVRSDIETIQILFSTIKSIHLKGVVGPYGEQGVVKDWVTVADIQRGMERPKLKQPEIRNFCEYQVKRGNLESRTGKDKFVTMADAEYRITQQGEQILATFKSDEFQKTRDMVSWSRQMAKSKDETNVTKEE